MKHMARMQWSGCGRGEGHGESIVKSWMPCLTVVVGKPWRSVMSRFLTVMEGKNWLLVGPKIEVPRVLFLGICLVFYYFLDWVTFPKL